MSLNKISMMISSIIMIYRGLLCVYMFVMNIMKLVIQVGPPSKGIWKVCVEKVNILTEVLLPLLCSNHIK